MLTMFQASMSARSLGTGESTRATGSAPAIQDRRPQTVSRTLVDQKNMLTLEFRT